MQSLIPFFSEFSFQKDHISIFLVVACRNLCKHFKSLTLNLIVPSLVQYLFHNDLLLAKISSKVLKAFVIHTELNLSSLPSKIFPKFLEIKPSSYLHFYIFFEYFLDSITPSNLQVVYTFLNMAFFQLDNLT
jgi:hypothetical protein